MSLWLGSVLNDCRLRTVTVHQPQHRGTGNSLTHSVPRCPLQPLTTNTPRTRQPQRFETKDFGFLDPQALSFIHPLFLFVSIWSISFSNVTMSCLIRTFSSSQHCWGNSRNSGITFLHLWKPKNDLMFDAGSTVPLLNDCSLDLLSRTQTTSPVPLKSRQSLPIYQTKKYEKPVSRLHKQPQPASHKSASWQLLNNGLSLTFPCCCSQHHSGYSLFRPQHGGSAHGPPSGRRPQQRVPLFQHKTMRITNSNQFQLNVRV